MTHLERGEGAEGDLWKDQKKKEFSASQDQLRFQCCLICLLKIYFDVLMGICLISFFQMFSKE